MLLKKIENFVDKKLKILYDNRHLQIVALSKHKNKNAPTSIRKHKTHRLRKMSAAN